MELKIKFVEETKKPMGDSLLRDVIALVKEYHECIVESITLNANDGYQLARHKQPARLRSAPKRRATTRTRTRRTSNGWTL